MRRTLAFSNIPTRSDAACPDAQHLSDETGVGAANKTRVLQHFLEKVDSPRDNLLTRTGKEGEYNQWWIEQQKGRRDETLTMGGVTFSVAHDVFSPGLASTNSVDLLLRHFPEVQGKRVLEIGTGCGVFAMKAAVDGAQKVIGTDVRAAALENATQNIVDTKLENVVQIVDNERFEDLPGSFDVIIMNIIFADRPTDTKQIDELGKQSLSLHRRLLSALPRKLNAGGVVVLGFGSFGDIETLQELLNDPLLDVTCVTEEKLGVNWYATMSAEQHRFQRIISVKRADCWEGS